MNTITVKRTGVVKRIGKLFNAGPPGFEPGISGLEGRRLIQAGLRALFLLYSWISYLVFNVLSSFYGFFACITLAGEYGSVFVSISSPCLFSILYILVVSRGFLPVNTDSVPFGCSSLTSFSRNSLL